ncbi:MAG: radical SAM protein [Planctomycetes bacterium]|nr:radical SAM protein [Planctomycetota bacterium]
MASTNYGVCVKCRRRIPITHDIRDGKVYVAKQCPDCGPTATLVSSDAATWQRKRDIWEYDEDGALTCHLHCDRCRREHKPKMVFLDVTNRCNMNCPICIANIPGMGFEFHPPLEYFERVAAGLAAMDSKPTVQLFGGEPTVRNDLFDIIAIMQRNGLRVRIVTNGLRLADEDYCKRVCALKIPVLIAFDGRDPEIYARLRKSAGAYEKKLKALENLKKHSQRKNIIMCCVARHINDRHMADLIAFCHENREMISAMHLIPLTETWEAGEFATDITTTIEDVEQIVAEAIPGEQVDFMSAGIGTYLKSAASFFGSPRITFGGAHPNCESMTMLLSDGARFRPIGHYLKRPLDDLAHDIVVLGRKLETKLGRLSPARWAQRWRGRLIILRTLLGPARRSLDLRKIFRGRPSWRIFRILAGLAFGRSLKNLLRRHTTIDAVLHMLVLPFEEFHSIEGARLENCPSGFVYEDPDTGEIKTVPVCAWSLYRAGIQRRIAEKYAAAPAAAPGPPVGLQVS